VFYIKLHKQLILVMKGGGLYLPLLKNIITIEKANMKNKHSIVSACIITMALFSLQVMSQIKNISPDEQYRPQVHFTPEEHWINDPNGMVFYKGTYHLFFQYHPYSSVWGPMHWGHTTSTDMIHWKRQPIAIYPDSLGTIFSGSAVVDKNNTTGFGKKARLSTNIKNKKVGQGQVPLVAMFTQHNMDGEKAGRSDYQNQSIAYSVDDGKTWKKYSGNPVIKTPGLKDFRDPKIIWYEPQKKWVVVIATRNYIDFYSSPDLKNWTKESEFGEGRGAHGGGWECPDLFAMKDDSGKQRWVLIVNLNPGAPNGGSGTQYFVGDFDGKTFTSEQTATQWLDYGPDNYAGVTFSNTGSRKILIGWMSNWQYANQVPTEKFRNGMTLPRELKIKHVGNDMLLSAEPVQEMASIQSPPVTLQNISLNKNIDLTKKLGKLKIPCRINLSLATANNFSFVFSNDLGEEVIVGYDQNQHQYFIDRTKSGKVDFQKDFAGRHTAPRLTDDAGMNISLVLDASSLELFADDGLTVMTSVVFPNKPFNQIQMKSSEEVIIKKLTFSSLKSIWQQGGVKK
jgi:fructan beta-fructosidase